MVSTDSPVTSIGALDDDGRVVEFFKTLVENGSDAIVSVDERSRIVYANRSTERVLGYEPDELIGEPLTMLMPDRYEDRHFDAIGRYIETGSQTLDWNNIELPAEHKDGHEVPLSITFEEHRCDGERIFSGIMRDISERVSREQQLERQNERLEQFASVVSHDLRGPLQTAKATLSVARERDDDDELLDELEAVHDRMEALVEDVLVLAKQGQIVGELESVDVSVVAEEAWETVGRGSATLTVSDSVTIRADSDRLRRLLENLFRNAVDHAGPDVTVVVGGVPNGFYVADDGDGFDVTDPEQAFEHGYTSDADGTGFGLSIVRSIADAHGWTVEVSDDDGASLEFTGVDRVE